jgi:hypothetical protein
LQSKVLFKKLRESLKKKTIFEAFHFKKSIYQKYGNFSHSSHSAQIHPTLLTEARERERKREKSIAAITQEDNTLCVCESATKLHN